MTATTAATANDRPRPPLWVVEGLDVVETRRRILFAVVGLVVLVGIVTTLLAPNLLPPTPLVGAAVALTAILLGLAAALAVDASDLRVRGPRHVGAAGGELVAILPVAPNEEDAAALADAVHEAREDGQSLLLGLAASSPDPSPTLAWTNALGTALARRGVSVLCVDLASGFTDEPGLAEVDAGERKLTEVVSFEPGLALARTGAGRDQREALKALVGLPGKLPRDLDMLLVALPITASRGVVQAARGLDHVLIVAERRETSRVDLIAALDALAAADLRAQVMLLDDRTAARLNAPGQAKVEAGGRDAKERRAAEETDEADASETPASDADTMALHDRADASETPASDADTMALHDRADASETPASDADTAVLPESGETPGTPDETAHTTRIEGVDDARGSQGSDVSDEVGATRRMGTSG
jgi:hypothetical protein